MTISENKVPPDGGYGWIIVFANILNNIFSTTALSNFGLVFRNLFDDITMPASTVITIITTTTVISIITGLISGPAIKYCGNKFVSFVAGCCFAIGLILCSNVQNNITHFVLTFGVVASIGYSLANCSFPLALSEYFRENRAKAMSISMTFTGLGPVFFPPLLAYLLNAYGIQGCVLIWGGLGLHIIVASLLLQPVKYHLKREYDVVYSETNKDIFIVNTTSVQLQKYKNTEDNFCLKKYEITKAKPEVEHPTSKKWHAKKQTIVKALDLDLFADKIYINIIIGMSFVACADNNFTVFTPFMFSELGFSTNEIASIMSLIGIFDIVFRYLSQFAKPIFNIDARMLYLISIIVLIFSRTALLFATSYKHLILIGIGLGASKGSRSVCTALILPKYMPIEKLAVANGMRKFLNNLWILCFTPIIANMRNLTNSYLNCIIYINILPLICVVLWIGELLVIYFNPYRKRRIPSIIPY